MLHFADITLDLPEELVNVICTYSANSLEKNELIQSISYDLHILQNLKESIDDFEREKKRINESVNSLIKSRSNEVDISMYLRELQDLVNKLERNEGKMKSSKKQFSQCCAQIVRTYYGLSKNSIVDETAVNDIFKALNFTDAKLIGKDASESYYDYEKRRNAEEIIEIFVSNFGADLNLKNYMSNDSPVTHKRRSYSDSDSDSESDSDDD